MKKIALIVLVILLAASTSFGQFAKVRFHGRKIVRVHPSFKKIAGKHGQQPIQLRNPSLGCRIILRPIF